MKRHNSTAKKRLQWLLIVVTSTFSIACWPAADNDLRSFTMTYGGSQILRFYEFSVDADGTAHFTSAVSPSERSKPRYTPDPPERTRFRSKISAEQFSFLRSAFAKSEFRSMGSWSFAETSTGGNLTNITAEYGTGKKVVSSQHGSRGPAFDSLKDAIEQVIDQIEWTEEPK